MHAEEVFVLLVRYGQVPLVVLMSIAVMIAAIACGGDAHDGTIRTAAG